MSKIIINGVKLKPDEIDGDWFMCPECEYKSCILKWFDYCPMCCTAIEFEEEND